ncbi:MAG: DUF898 family protein [Candidatus Accumulibacter sp.]|jgi:uncharacterized membrane protein YjgN (DUF898 family)|nr:DUF898 family protein [Accumulibacter sp.]
MQKNHYQILGLRDGATQEEVKAAHDKALRRFVLRHKEGRPLSREDFDAMEEAYAVLREPVRRAVYDRELFGAPSPAAREVPSSASFPDGRGVPGGGETAPRDPLLEARSKEPITYAFEFTGSGSEYFRIWIVNLVLSILTLGIYSAWAKVRREQYFHRNTLLDGSGFDYHGKPGAILKGRLIAYGLFFMLNVVENFFPFFYPLALLAASPIVPWLLVRSFGFRARNTSYRGLRFNFHGTYMQCVITFLPYLLLFLAVVLLVWHRMRGGGRGYSFGMQILITLSPLLVFALVFPAIFGSFKRFQINNLLFGRSRFKCAAGFGGFYAIFLRTMLVGFAFLTFIYFFVLFVRFSSIFKQTTLSPHGMPLGVLLVLVIMGIMFLASQIAVLAYFQSRAANFVWGNTTLDRRQFVSTQTFKELFTLHVSNGFLTLLTLGLYWPWAKVNLAAYRARNTMLIAEGGLDNFVGRVSEEVRATGEEILDVFDFDIAL